MSAVAVIALLSGALALYAAVLVARISLAPGSRDARWFALAAAAAGVYALSSPVILLSVARALVEGQGGSLRLESVPGEGTTARLELPGAEGDAPPAA